MKQRKVWRYWCDFCNKGGCSKSAMARHEQHCTMNPQRTCGLCAHDQDLVQKHIEVLKAAYGVGLEELRRVSGGCPVCMLAAIRQWKKDHEGEMDSHWDNWDYRKAMADYRSCSTSERVF